MLNELLDSLKSIHGWLKQNAEIQQMQLQLLTQVLQQQTSSWPHSRLESGWVFKLLFDPPDIIISNEN